MNTIEEMQARAISFSEMLRDLAVDALPDGGVESGITAAMRRADLIVAFDLARTAAEGVILHGREMLDTVERRWPFACPDVRVFAVTFSNRWELESICRAVKVLRGK